MGSVTAIWPNIWTHPHQGNERVVPSPSSFEIGDESTIIWECGEVDGADGDWTWDVRG